jgi:UDP-N-acetylglucosamine 3-dehydrogenase
VRKLRVGIIGLGQVSEVHLRGYEDVPQIKVVAGAEPRADRLAQMAAQWGLQAYTDYEEMLQKEKLDIACVLTPAPLHRQITEQVAGHGVHVLCEKPMALSLADARAMINKCEQEGVKLYYGSSYRHLCACRKAKEIIDAGILGDLFLLMETFVGGRGLDRWQGLSEHHYPKGGPGGGGLGLVDHGIHLADVFRWLTGSEVESVFGRGNTSGETPAAEYLTMCFESGAVGQLVYCDATYSSDLPYEGMFSWGLTYEPSGALSPRPRWETEPGSIRVHGTKGALRIFHYANKLFFFGEGRQEQVRVLDRPHPGNFSLQMESFANSILRDKEPEVTGTDGLKALQVILAAYESFESQKIMPVEPVL